MAKKIIILAFLVLVLSGCTKAQPKTASSKESKAADSQTVETTSSKADGIDIDITEKMYIHWINEIYTNTEPYLGKKVRIQGIYMKQIEEDGKSYHYVYRQGPGCCGNDGTIAGFEIAYDGIEPKDNDWIEVIGVLEEYEEEDSKYLILKADSVRVQSERGAEVLYQ